MDIPLIQQRYAHCKGIAFVEFSLIALLLVSIVLGVVEYGRYVALMNRVVTAANKGISAASVLEKLDQADSVDLAKQEIINEVYASLGESPDSGEFSVLVNLPTLSAGQSMRDVLNENPLTVQVSTMFESVVPLVGAIPIHQVASGYRERIFSSSFPASSNCHGEPLDPSEPIALNPLGTPEPCCPPGQVFVNGECGCAGLSQLAEDGTCVCVGSVDQCGPDERYLASDCRCEACPRGRTRSSSNPDECICKDEESKRAECHAIGEVLDEKWCSCLECTDEDGVPRVADLETDKCVCANIDTVNIETCAALNQLYHNWHCDCFGECLNGSNPSPGGYNCENCTLDCPGATQPDRWCGACICDDGLIEVRDEHNVLIDCLSAADE